MEDSSLERALKDLPKLLREREEALEEREKEWMRLKAGLERERPHGTSASVSNVVRLNVGGRRIDVLRRTLTQVEGSLLGCQFSKRWTSSWLLEQDADGCAFIDQPPQLFVPLIDYLRAKQTETPLAKRAAPPKFDDSKIKDDFQRMVEYYGLSLAVYPMGIYRLDDMDTDQWSLVGEGECQLEASHWTTYALKPLEDIHNRSVESFEITLDHDCSSVKVGWIYLSSLQTWFALDCVKSGIIEHRNFRQLPFFVDLVQQGTTIRSEKWGNDWYVDGVLVASTREEGSNILKLTMSMPSSTTVPGLSFKGTCRISKIELTF